MEEILKLVGIYWLVIFSAVVVVIYIRDKAKISNWGILSHFLRESVEEIESKVFSFDEALEPKFIVDDKGAISIINRSASELFGISKENVTGKSIDVVVPETERDEFHGMFEIIKERRFKMDALCKDRVCPVEVVIRKKEVSKRTFFLIIMRDRTDEVRISRNLEQVIAIQKIKLEVLIKGEEVGNSGSWIWDLAKDNLITSPGYRNIMGLDPRQAEYDRQYIRDKVYGKDDEIVKEALSKAFRGESYEITYRIMRSKDFKLVEILSRARPIMNENNVLIYIYGHINKIREIDIIEATSNKP